MCAEKRKSLVCIMFPHFSARGFIYHTDMCMDLTTKGLLASWASLTHPYIWSQYTFLISLRIGKYHKPTCSENVMKNYTLKVLLAFDQLLNTIVGGYPNETLSARAWRKGTIENRLWWNRFMQLVDFAFKPIHQDHCKTSYEYCRTCVRVGDIYFPTKCSHESLSYHLSVIDHLDLGESDKRPK